MRLLALRADPKLQALVDELSRKCNEGKLTPAEEVEYSHYVAYSTFIAFLKARSRQIVSTKKDAK
jgi:hypothetical protein